MGNDELEYCMNCRYFDHVEFEPTHTHMGSCSNPIFHVGYGKPEDAQVLISGAVIEADEGWGWRVGRNFGCRHFKVSVTND